MTRNTTTATAKAIGQSLLAARTRLGLTQDEAAKKAGFDGNTWARYERGEREPALSRIQRIEAALKTKITFGTEPFGEVPVEQVESALSDEGRRTLLSAARRLQDLAQEMMDEALATTPMHVPMSAEGVRDVFRQSKQGRKQPRSA